MVFIRRSSLIPHTTPRPVFSRLYVQTQKIFKISEERVKEHVQTFSLVRPGPGSEGPREPGEDPYDFKEDLEYTFSSSKRLRGQGRDPSRRAKVG